MKRKTIDVDSWIKIPWYDWIYEIKISTNQIRSLYNWKVKIMSLWIWKSWHMQTALYKHWLSKSFWIHQIVMLIKEWPCPKWMEVCHNDGNPKNNHPDNLRYGTRSSNVLDQYKHWVANNIFQTKHPKFWEWKKWSNHPTSKNVSQYDLNWNLIKTYWSAYEAWEFLWIHWSWISRCARWGQKTAWLFIWKY